jgi:hypothetical protein
LGPSFRGQEITPEDVTKPEQPGHVCRHAGLDPASALSNECSQRPTLAVGRLSDCDHSCVVDIKSLNAKVFGLNILQMILSARVSMSTRFIHDRLIIFFRHFEFHRLFYYFNLT